MAIFPTFAGARNGVFHTNREARRWRDQYGGDLTNPRTRQSMVERVHQENGWPFSWGGWFEDRRLVRRDERCIHLGVDFNAPAGTDIALDHAACVLCVDNDHPREEGWGPRVFFQLEGHLGEIVLIYAHLAGIMCKAGDLIRAGETFAKVGSPDSNGGWHPHVHVQAVRLGAYAHAISGGSVSLYGYCSQRDIDEYVREEKTSDCDILPRKFKLRQDFPNPMDYVSVSPAIPIHV